MGVVGVQTGSGVPAQDSFSFQSITLTIHNSGKTPALKLSGDCCMFVTHVWTDPIPDYDSEVAAADEARRESIEEQIRRNPKSPIAFREFEATTASAVRQAIHTGGVIAPGVVTGVNIAPSMKVGTGRKPDANGFRSPPTTLYILGKFTYNDVFDGSERHTTKFCLMRLTGNSVTIAPKAIGWTNQARTKAQIRTLPQIWVT